MSVYIYIRSAQLESYNESNKPVRNKRGDILFQREIISAMQYFYLKEIEEKTFGMMFFFLLLLLSGRKRVYIYKRIG